MRINDLVNKVEPFRFVYDNYVLEGEYYKYRTTTPKYIRALNELAHPHGDSTEEEKAEALNKANFQILADTVKSWNAIDDQGAAVAIEKEIFEQLPFPFIRAFSKYLGELREPNPTPAASPSS